MCYLKQKGNLFFFLSCSIVTIPWQPLRAPIISFSIPLWFTHLTHTYPSLVSLLVHSHFPLALRLSPSVRECLSLTCLWASVASATPGYRFSVRTEAAASIRRREYIRSWFSVAVVIIHVYCYHYYYYYYLYYYYYYCYYWWISIRAI